MKKLSALALHQSVSLAIAGMTLVSLNLPAATLNWSPGGNANASETWTNPNVWNNGAPVTWVDGSDAVFNRTTTSIISVFSATGTPVTANSITVNLATAASTTVQFNNQATSPLTLTTGNFTVASGAYADFRLDLRGSNGLSLSGGGILSLGNANSTFTGTISVASSTLELRQTNGAFGNAANSITLDQGILSIQHPNTVTVDRGISLIGDSTIRLRDGNTNNPTVTFSGIISGSKKLTYDNNAAGVGGTTKVTVSGNNAYSGGTVLNFNASSVTFDVGSNTAFGTQGVQVQGNSQIQILAPVTIANNVTVESAGATLLRTTAATGAYSVGTTGALSSSFASGTENVAARIRSGTNGSGSNQVLAMSFSATPDVMVSNDAVRRSDIFSINGTGSQVFTLQLSMSGTSLGDALGWLNAGSWANAVTGNTGSGALAGFYAMSYDQFLANNGGSFNASTMLGAWGVETIGGNVWSVLNHGTGADFAVIPEPGTITMLILAGGLLFFRRWRVRAA